MSLLRRVRTGRVAAVVGRVVGVRLPPPERGTAMSGQTLWQPAYVALGSNLDDPVQQVQRGFAALGELPHTRLVACSSLWRSRPLGPVDQPDFINAVAGLLTQCDPETMLRHLKHTEQAMGRATPIVRWGPRRIDLDLLVLGVQRREGERLTLPHPGIAERLFVLAPLAEIAPELMIVGVGRVRTLLSRLDASAIERLSA